MHFCVICHNVVTKLYLYCILFYRNPGLVDFNGNVIMTVVIGFTVSTISRLMNISHMIKVVIENVYALRLKKIKL